MPKEVWLVIGAGCFTLLGAGIVAGANLFNTRRERLAERKKQVSKGFLDESLLLLSRAYETFNRCGTGEPIIDLRLFLSTARMIARFQNMRDRITESDHRDVIDEHEEYWRLQFCTQLRGQIHHLFNVKYMLSGICAPLDRKALAVIFDFAKWRKGMFDPLESANDMELFAKGVVPPDFRDLINYLKRDESYWAEVMRLRESIDDGS